MITRINPLSALLDGSQEIKERSSSRCRTGRVAQCYVQPSSEILCKLPCPLFIAQKLSYRQRVGFLLESQPHCPDIKLTTVTVLTMPKAHFNRSDVVEGAFLLPQAGPKTPTPDVRATVYIDLLIIAPK